MSNEPPHDKTNKMTCAPSEDSDQPGRPPSLIILRCLHEETLGPELPIKRTTKTGRMPRLIWVFTGCTSHIVGFVIRQLKWAWAQQNLQNGPGHAKTCLMPYANNKGADQPAHPRSLISTIIIRRLDSSTPLVVIFEIWRLQLASVAEQSGLNLTWSKIPEDTFFAWCGSLMMWIQRRHRSACTSTIKWATSWENLFIPYANSKGVAPLLFTA